MSAAKTSKTRKTIDRFIRDHYPEYEDKILLADGFDECLVGFVYKDSSHPVAVYSKKKMIAELTRNLGSESEANEYFESNLEDADAGEYTPLYLESFPQG